MELLPRTPYGMPMVPGELRGGHPWLAMRGRDWLGLVEKGMEITDSMCRAGEVGTAARTGMLEDRGCLVDMKWMFPGRAARETIVGFGSALDRGNGRGRRSDGRECWADVGTFMYSLATSRATRSLMWGMCHRLGHNPVTRSSAGTRQSPPPPIMVRSQSPVT